MSKFSKQGTVGFKISASFLNNNLTTYSDSETGVTVFGIAHKSTVFVISKDEPDPRNAVEVINKEQQQSYNFASIMQAKFVKIGARVMLVCLSTKGIQIYDYPLIGLAFWHALGETEPHACGVTAIGQTLCIGTGMGKLLCFKVPDKGPNFTLDQSLSASVSAVTALASDQQRVYVGGESGLITVYAVDASGQLQHKTNTANIGTPCTSLAPWRGHIVAAFGDGLIRIYSADECSLQVEVAAHARCITALDVSECGLVASVSDDTYIRCFQLDEQPDGINVTLAFNDIVTDRSLVGVQCMETGGLAVSAYDTGDVTVYGKC